MLIHTFESHLIWVKSDKERESSKALLESFESPLSKDDTSPIGVSALNTSLLVASRTQNPLLSSKKNPDTMNLSLRINWRYMIIMEVCRRASLHRYSKYGFWELLHLSISPATHAFHHGKTRIFSIADVILIDSSILGSCNLLAPFSP